MIVLYFVIVPLWAVSFIRIPIALKNPRARPLTWTFLALAAGLTVIRPLVVYDTYQLTGWTPLSNLLKAIFGMIAMASLLRWVVSITPAAQDTVKPPRYHRVIADRSRRTVTAAALTLSVAASPWLHAPVPTRQGVDILLTQDGDIPGTIHLGIFYAYLTFSAGCCALMCISTWSRDKRGFLGAGMGLMAFGCIMGTGYGVVRTVGLVISSTGSHMPVSLMAALTTYLALLSCLSLVLGSLLPFGERVGRRMGAMAQLRHLYPLWRDVTQAVPQVMLPGTRDRRGDDWLNFADPAGRLNRRRIEILDGLSRLRPWMPDVVREAVLASTPSGAEADALVVVVAIWIKHMNFAADAAQTRALLSEVDQGSQLYLEKVGRLMRQWPVPQAARSTRLWAEPAFAPVLESLGLARPVQEATS